MSASLFLSTASEKKLKIEASIFRVSSLLTKLSASLIDSHHNSCIITDTQTFYTVTPQDDFYIG